MSLAISTHMPDHLPVMMSLLKYGASPGNAATRNILVRWIRSNAVPGAGCWARADFASSAEPPAAVAALAANSRRDNIASLPAQGSTVWYLVASILPSVAGVFAAAAAFVRGAVSP